MKKTSLLFCLLVLVVGAAGLLAGCEEKKNDSGPLMLLSGLLGITEHHDIEVFVYAQALPDGGLCDFGDVADTMSDIRSIRIHNISGGDITISSVEKSSGDTGEFIISTLGMTSPLASNGNTYFSITFDSTSIGEKNAIISINYSPGEEPYTFTVRGSAVGCLDLDGDGYGDGTGCAGEDCNDSSPLMYPDAPEVCGNSLDDDCDDSVDEGCPLCVDADLDGYGEGIGCLGTDCVDTDPSIYQGAPELCDGKDNDCDFTVDEGC